MTIATEIDRLTTLASADRGDAPCSRYGTRYADYVPFIVAGQWAMVAANGSDDESAELNDMTSLVVNDSPDVAYVICEYWFALPRALRQQVGGLRHVRSLMDS